MLQWLRFMFSETETTVSKYITQFKENNAITIVLITSKLNIYNLKQYFRSKQHLAKFHFLRHYFKHRGYDDCCTIFSRHFSSVSKTLKNNLFTSWKSAISDVILLNEVETDLYNKTYIINVTKDYLLKS